MFTFIAASEVHVPGFETSLGGEPVVTYTEPDAIAAIARAINRTKLRLRRGARRSLSSRSRTTQSRQPTRRAPCAPAGQRRAGGSRRRLRRQGSHRVADNESEDRARRSRR